MEIAHGSSDTALDRRAVHKMPGADQRFGETRGKFDLRAGDQHSMRGRDDQLSDVPDRAVAKDDRRMFALRRHARRTDPADRLKTVIGCPNDISYIQVLDRPRTLGCLDHRARAETGDRGIVDLVVADIAFLREDILLSGNKRLFRNQRRRRVSAAVAGPDRDRIDPKTIRVRQGVVHQNLRASGICDTIDGDRIDERLVG